MADAHAEQFESRERQVGALHLGMWTFLASELLLFAALFGLYGAYRAEYPAAFGFGVEHNDRALGTLNTVILISSSYLAAMGLHAARGGHRARAALLLWSTVAAGGGFLFVKGLEYAAHIHEHAVPGGDTRYFVEHALAGLPTFYTLYFFTTALHGIHVIVGMTLLAVMAVKASRGATTSIDGSIALGVLYWHFVDIVWIFLWPLFYLLPGVRS